MKVGDVVRWVSVEGQPMGIVVSDIRHGSNGTTRSGVSVVDILSKGTVIAVNIQALRVTSESRQHDKNKEY